MNQIESITEITPMTPMTPMTPITTRTVKNRKKIKKSKKSKKNATRRKNRGMVGGITPEKFAKDEATSMEFNNNLITLPDGTTVMKNKLEDFMGKPTGDVEYTISYKGNKVPKILIEKTKKDGPTTMRKKIKGKELDLSPEDAKDVAKLNEYKKKAEENIAKRKEEIARAAKVEVEVAAPVAKVTRSIPRNFHGELTGDIDYTIVDEQGKQNMLRRKQDGSFKKIIVKNYVSQESDTSPDDEKDIQKVNEFDAEHPIDVDSPTFREKFPLVANPKAAGNADVIAPAPVNPPLPEAEAISELAAPPPPPEAAENVDVIAPAPVNPPLPEAEAISEVAAAAPVNPPLPEAEISGEASAPPQEAEISGEASAPPLEEAEVGNEASAPPLEEAEAGNEASAPPLEEAEVEISSEMDAAGKALREEAKRLQEKLDALKSQLNMIPEAPVESALEPEPVAATPETAGGGGGFNKMMKKRKKTFHKKYNSRISMKRKNKTNRNKYNMDHFVL